MNRLSNEKSPYLIQHANNPVDWYPWNDEALSLAKKTGKPIFLSIGYSTCHWCHVMAHESFENPKTADIMNKHFINIKVDREERPDLDAIYMSAVQALTGSGGWPMSVWLTPDLKPFFGGTYFPREDSHGRPGFPSVLTQLAEVWEKDNDRAQQAATQITELLESFSMQSKSQEKPAIDAKKISANLLSYLKTTFDPLHGGFSPAPKFPMPVYMRFLLEHHKETGDKDALNMVSFTMQKIISGGITDQLGGGFARYSVDERWVVPHFEKMLYDNAQLISVCAGLYEATHEKIWEEATRKAISYIYECLRHPDGAFFAAEDADSEGKEGTFYIWTLNEIKQHLDPESADLFIRRYGVTLNGNFFDPHTQEVGKNVLVQAEKIESPKLDAAEKKLLNIRNKRPRPHRDEKILTEWNGLMISALAQAKELDAAAAAARFIKKNMYDAGNKLLYRSWFNGKRSIEGLQADYALLIQGLLDLNAFGGSYEWVDWAAELQETQDKLFFDHELGGYFMNVPRADVLIRLKDDSDNVVPSGNSIAVLNGLRLAALTGRTDFREKADRTLQAFAPKLERHPASMAALAAALSKL